MNYYELLEISPSASVEVIRNAYKTLAKKYHPDTYRGDIIFAEEKMKLLNEAISVLEDEGKRAEYNKINGISPLAKSGYSEYGRNNMLNVDENGESIFFSYGLEDLDDLDDAGLTGDDNAAYMDIIDDFISNAKPGTEKKPKKKSAKIKERKFYPDDDFDDNAEPAGTENINDIMEDISEINSVAPVEGDMGYAYEIAGDLKEDENDDDFKTFNISARTKPRGRPTSNIAKWYYIVLAFLITANVFLFALILRSIDINNIKNLFAGISGKSEPPDDSVGKFGLDENYTGNDDELDDKQPNTPDVEFITEPPAGTDPEPEPDEIVGGETDPAAATPAPTEPTTAKPAANNNQGGTTPAKPPAATQPPAPITTKAPVTDPPATTEEITGEPATEHSTTEEPSEPPTESEVTSDDWLEPTEEPSQEESGPEPPSTEPETIADAGSPEIVAPQEEYPDEMPVDEES